MTWWLRLRRLWAQDRIRLSAGDLRSIDLAVGDRLEILGQLWAVEAMREPRAGLSTAPSFTIATLSVPRRRATLRRTEERPGDPPHRQGWSLQDATGKRCLHRRDVLHYAVGSTLRGRSLFGTTWRRPPPPGVGG